MIFDAVYALAQVERFFVHRHASSNLSAVSRPIAYVCMHFT